SPGKRFAIVPTNSDICDTPHRNPRSGSLSPHRNQQSSQVRSSSPVYSDAYRLLFSPGAGDLPLGVFAVYAGLPSFLDVGGFSPSCQTKAAQDLLRRGLRFLQKNGLSPQNFSAAGGGILKT